MKAITLVTALFGSLLSACALEPAEQGPVLINDEPTVDEPTIPPTEGVLDHDCDLYNFESYRVAGGELGIVGIYESRDSRTATVRVAHGGPSTLVLSSVEPVDFVVEVADDATLERIIVTGLSLGETHRVTYPQGVKLEFANLGAAFDVAGAAELVDAAEELTGKRVGAFYGCSEMSTLTLGE
jgi:hypothetical protein